MTAARRLGRYSVGERIGTGGVADVFLAEVEGPEGFAKTVVLKTLRPHVADLPEVVEALIEEARLAQGLQHGNIVQVFDFAVDDGLPYVVMEHVDGCTLRELTRDLARRGQRMPLEAALYVVEQVAAALAYAHRLVDDDGMPRDLVHRDVKPSNILLSRDGLVKLTDFGIAKVADRGRETLPGVLKGTPTYWAPEQAAGDPVDARADVYGLGVVLRELVDDSPTSSSSSVEITGSTSSMSESLEEVDARVDEALREIIDDATATTAKERLASMSELAARLRRWAAAAGVLPGPERVADLVRRAKRDKPVARRVALDSALLSTAKGDMTLQRGPTAVEATSAARPVWKQAWLGGVLAAAVAAAIVVGMSGRGGDETAARSGVGERIDAKGEPGPAERAHDDASARDDDASAGHPTAPDDAPVHDDASARDDASAHDTAAHDDGTAHDTDSTPAQNTATDPPQATDGTTEASDDDQADGDATEAARDDPPPKARKGLLRVNMLPWANVSIDGKPYGRVPVEARLRPGKHRVVLDNPSVGTKRITVTVHSGQPTSLTHWPS